MTSITNDVLAAKLDVVISRQEKTDVKLDSMDTKYISHAVYDLNLRDIDLRIKTIETSIKDMSRRRWVQNTLSAILGVILTTLSIFFVEHIGR